MTANLQEPRPAPHRLAPVLTVLWCLCGALIAEPAWAAAPGKEARAASAAGPAGSDAAPKPALVDINTASEADLRTLPDITAARARAIVNGRPYAKTKELFEQGILPEAVYDRIKNQLTASKPAPKN